MTKSNKNKVGVGGLEEGLKDNFEILPTSKVPLVRQSGHFVDQKLKYTGPNANVAAIFDSISPDLQGDVKKFEIQCEGIRLSAAEDRLLNTIYNLLKINSENKDIDSENFYKGNYFENKLTQSFGGENVHIAQIRIQPADLYKAYLGNRDYSGKEIQEIHGTMQSLATKFFYMKYVRTRLIKIGRKTEERKDTIELVQQLIVIIKASWGGDETTDTKKEFILALNPILTDQINSKYVEYPEDINRRMILASGGDHKKVTGAMNALRDWCLRMISSRQYKVAINADKIPLLLGLNEMMKHGRKKRIQDTINNSIQTCKNLGIILNAEETIGKEGQVMFIFKLNRDFR